MGTVTYHVKGDSIYLPHKKINGVKYYIENDNGNESVFSMLNEEKNNSKQNITIDEIKNNNQGIEFYKQAKEFTDFVNSNQVLRNLSSSNAVDLKGNQYTNNGPYTQDIKIFEELNGSGKAIEDKDSDFYLHRTEVIKNAIESNLMVAIDNFNNVSSSGVQFAMPKLTDNDWENLTSGISMITFLQGLSIGGRIYNGYSIVENNTNDDFISENSIYIVVGDTYYLPTDTNLLNSGVDLTNGIGILNSNFEVRNVKDTIDNDNNQIDVYYYPRQEKGAYTSVIEPGASTNLSDKSIEEYMKEYANSTNAQKKRIAQIYYTGLGRERNSMFKVNNNHT